MQHLDPKSSVVQEVVPVKSSTEVVADTGNYTSTYVQRCWRAG
jgi:hypothetical protein